MQSNINKFIYWTPRILSILFICFLALFSFDVITPGASFWQIVMGLLVHNIPVFILLATLIISWKWEIVGGVVFILAGLLYIIFAKQNAPGGLLALSWSLTISGPALLIGILFIINWRKKVRSKRV